MDKYNKLTRLILSAFFLALAYVMPFLTGQMPTIGNMLCPMHIPVLLCGFLCGWYWGLAIGFVAPLFRSLTLGMPTLFPKAVCMSLELATYGLIAGLMYKLLPRKRIYLYISLLTAMLVGRIIWGTAMFICVGIKGGEFGFAAFLTNAFANAVPGIILQIVLIPIIVEKCESMT